MAKKLYDKLKEWEIKDDINRVLLIGEGKHFCAGGDVKSLFLSQKTSKLKHDFFKTEYRLNFLISRLKSSKGFSLTRVTFLEGLSFFVVIIAVAFEDSAFFKYLG